MNSSENCAWNSDFKNDSSNLLCGIWELVLCSLDSHTSLDSTDEIPLDTFLGYIFCWKFQCCCHPCCLRGTSKLCALFAVLFWSFLCSTGSNIELWLQPGTFDLVGSVFYELDNQLYKSVFYNGTVEVVEPSGFVSGETMFLVTLGLGLLGLLGMWAYAQVQKFSKVLLPPLPTILGLYFSDGCLFCTVNLSCFIIW